MKRIEDIKRANARGEDSDEDDTEGADGVRRRLKGGQSRKRAPPPPVRTGGKKKRRNTRK